MIEKLPRTPEGKFIANDISPDNFEGFITAVKKPIAIKAIQLNFSEGFSVQTKEGVMTGKPGDYLLIGIHGEKYPCDKEIFECSYNVNLNETN